ncbi:hypothetical protein [Enterovirga rhinocerotis]|nr:hypothetical protein [Enterovirga rhinocerotis]
MRRLRLFLLLTAASAAFAPAAQAQNFFERLFGIAPSRPVAPQPAPVAPGPDGFGAGEPPRARPAPIQARPVSLRVPSEEALLGKELKQNGSSGSLRIERVGGRSDLRARITLVGRRSAQSVETCSVALGGSDGVPLVSQGRGEGLQRFSIDEAGCSLTLDILDESVLVKGAGESCLFQAAQCQADASGLWGPEPNQLLGRAREYESIRASADKAARENYKVLVQRARPEGVRPIVAEQAAFSSERETTCRGYAREPQHSFCNARFSEGRAITLAQRLGVAVAAAAQPGGPTQGPTRVRVREQVQPRDPYGIPPTNELVERNPFDD